MSTGTTPTGRKQQRAGSTYVVLTRTFRAPIEDVWAAVTEPGRPARWIGRWTGDPATGKVPIRTRSTSATTTRRWPGTTAR